MTTRTENDRVVGTTNYRDVSQLAINPDIVMESITLIDLGTGVSSGAL